MNREQKLTLIERIRDDLITLNDGYSPPDELVGEQEALQRVLIEWADFEYVADSN